MNEPQNPSHFAAQPIKLDLAEPKLAPTGDPEQDLQVFPATPEELSPLELSPVELAPLTPLRTPHGPDLVKGTSPNERRMKANAKGTKKKKQTETSLSMPARMSGDWIEALNIVPNIVVFPHHRPASQESIQMMHRAVGGTLFMLGIDEATACLSDNGSVIDWTVSGAGTVTVYSRAGLQTYSDGQRFVLK